MMYHDPKEVIDNLFPKKSSAEDIQSDFINRNEYRRKEWDKYCEKNIERSIHSMNCLRELYRNSKEYRDAVNFLLESVYHSPVSEGADIESANRVIYERGYAQALSLFVFPDAALANILLRKTQMIASSDLRADDSQ